MSPTPEQIERILSADIRKQGRRGSGMTLADLANELGLSYSAVKRVRCDRKVRPNAKRLSLYQNTEEGDEHGS